MRSGKEVEGSSSKKKIVIDDDEVEIEEVEVSDKKDDECATKSEKEDAILIKELSKLLIQIAPYIPLRKRKYFEVYIGFIFLR